MMMAMAATFSSLPPDQSALAVESEGTSGFEGMISISPTTGGPIRQRSPDSRPLPNITFLVKTKDETVSSFTTDDQGRFRVLLAPGHYTVWLKEPTPRLGHYGPFEVDVEPGKLTKVEWECDTGMR